MAYKRNPAQKELEIDNLMEKRNREFLRKIDLQIVLQLLQERDYELSKGMFASYKFLWYFTGGLFVVYNWYFVMLTSFHKKKKERLAAKNMVDLGAVEKELEANRIDKRAISCKLCHKTNGTLIKVEGGYVHKECEEKVKEMKKKK